ESIYSLNPPTVAERYAYVKDVIGHWDCKSVTADSLTYHFLICRTTTLPRSIVERSRMRPAFGASAYFILSDGKEAASSVRLTFDGADNAKHIVEDASLTNAATAAPTSDPAWEVPDADEKILDVLRDEFRIRFASPAWPDHIGAIQVLSGKKLLSLD